MHKMSPVYLGLVDEAALSSLLQFVPYKDDLELVETVGCSVCGQIFCLIRVHPVEGWRNEHFLVGKVDWLATGQSVLIELHDRGWTRKNALELFRDGEWDGHGGKSSGVKVASRPNLKAVA